MTSWAFSSNAINQPTMELDKCKVKYILFDSIKEKKEATYDERKDV